VPKVSGRSGCTTPPGSGGGRGQRGLAVALAVLIDQRVRVVRIDDDLVRDGDEIETVLRRTCGTTEHVVDGLLLFEQPITARTATRAAATESECRMKR